VVQDWRAITALASSGDIGLAEGYRDGWWSSDDLVQLFYFGLQNEIKLYLEFALQDVPITKYIKALEKNFYRKKLYFGEVKFANASSNTGEPIYDLVYVDIKDPMNNQQDISVSREISQKFARGFTFSGISGNNVTIDTPGVGQQNVKASEARILGGYVEIVNSASKTKGDTVPFSYAFSTDFKYAPIAVATPVNIGNTPAGKNVSVVLKSVTTSKVEGVVLFNETGDLTVAVNLVVIGIPN
jgi:hypothetical protein